MNWTEEQEALLKRLWEANDSASKIAKRMGITRNAVIGKTYRMIVGVRGKAAAKPWTPEQDTRLREFHAAGESQRAIGRAMGYGVTTIARHLRQLGLHGASISVAMRRHHAKRTELRPVKIHRRIIDVPKPTCEPVSMLDRTDRQCAYIEGEPVANAPMCGAKAEDGSSWCAYHYRLVYVTTRGENSPAKVLA